ncbi:DUF2798 domain-containing protein [Planomicrobium sp. CPCC 101110]|uniref:DUF2798 domain-containing protein n=1 Tax=Planomicrobium sp. CPCC 101110 TaxID=2599619 RepID=UPI0011B76E37|nr:DUF2798 domain-containing protein [Planomicrobium sp. CPCC 101110]TWT25245.1 DUF2798 domain-containing protein [Planomicrobium sp. CPCC 101110]
MHQEKRLPQNGKEGFLYGAIICTLTVLLMVSFNAIYFAGTFNKEIAFAILKILPLVWVIVMILEPVVIGRLAEALTAKFTEPTDSFNSKVLFRILFTVLGMSIIMTFIGDIISNGFHAEFLSNWLNNWPRNFAIALIAESIAIQPLARLAMVKLHEAQDKKAAAAANAQAQ